MLIHEYRMLSLQVQAIYNSRTDIFSEFQKTSGLVCLPGCGACCLQPTVEATSLEMLPLALEIVDSGRVEEIMNKLEKADLNCILYQKNSDDGKKGQCSEYQFRAVICRTFGACATRDKNQKLNLSVCKLIKEEHPDQYQLAKENLQDAPIIGVMAQQLRNLDPILGSKLLPINQALKIMLEKLLLVQHYE